MSIRKLHSSNSTWESLFGFSRAVEFDDTLYISKTGALNSNGEITASGISEQTHLILEKISGILEQANFTLADVVQSRLYLTDIDRWQEAAEVHGQYFGDIRPAFTLLHVLPFPEKRMTVAIEIVARRQRRASNSELS